MEAATLMDLEEATRKFARARALSKDPGRVHEALRLYEEAAAAGLAEAQLNLGAMLEAGACGLRQDLGRAVQLYTAAAEQGLSPALYNLGRLYECGDGVMCDPARAAELYHLAAKQGNADAMVNLAGILARGEAGPPNAAGAIEWHTRAANLGQPQAMRALGIAHVSGEGNVAIDYQGAADWLRRAAEGGDGYAWFELGKLLWRGRGVRRDRVRALLYAVRAGRTDGGWREIVASLRPWTVRVLRRLHLTD